jgi:hypothetical protein
VVRKSVEKKVRQSSQRLETEVGKVKQSQQIEEKITNSQYIASGNIYANPASGNSTAKSSGQIKPSFKKQSSQITMKRQPSSSSITRPGSAMRKDEKTSLKPSDQPRKTQKTDKPIKAKEPFITSLENFAREMEQECERLVTEEEEHQIREVASDINERAFYGKIMRTKKALE